MTEEEKRSSMILRISKSLTDHLQKNFKDESSNAIRLALGHALSRIHIALLDTAPNYEAQLVEVEKIFDSIDRLTGCLTRVIKAKNIEGVVIEYAERTFEDGDTGNDLH